MAALTTWVEWTPMSQVTSSSVVDACAFFLTAPEFALQGLDVLKHVSVVRMPCATIQRGF